MPTAVLKVADGNVGPLAVSIEFEPGPVCAGKQLLLRAIPVGVNRQVMERRACPGAVPKHLHVAKHAIKVNGHRISDLEDFDLIVLGLQQVGYKCGAVPCRSPMFRRGDDHLRLSGP